MAKLRTYEEGQRRIARRLWDGGLPRKRIAAMLDVPELTIKDWRYRYDWPPRQGNHMARRDPKRRSPRRSVPRHDHAPIEMTATLFTCPRCGCRCEWPQGHESWCNEWLQQRYRVGAA
jgi:hypothetical protein